MAPFRDIERERIERITDLVRWIHDSPGGYKLSFDLVFILILFLEDDYLLFPSQGEIEARK